MLDVKIERTLVSAVVFGFSVLVIESDEASQGSMVLSCTDCIEGTDGQRRLAEVLFAWLERALLQHAHTSLAKDSGQSDSGCGAISPTLQLSNARTRLDCAAQQRGAAFRHRVQASISRIANLALSPNPTPDSACAADVFLTAPSGPLQRTSPALSEPSQPC